MILWIGLIMIMITIMLLVGMCSWTWYHPESVLIPLNLLYQLDPSPRTNIYSEEESSRIFPTGIELESQWHCILEEGYALYERLPNKNMNYLDNYHMNIGNEDKQNWTTIPLRLFGRDSLDHMNHCPITAHILQSHPEIKSCLFSIMAPGKIIHPHVGPYDGMLRYQLALDIPEPANSNEECYLHVNGQRYEWIPGKGVLFDEAHLHGAVNTTSKQRMVLLIDIERPYWCIPYRWLNTGIIWGMGALPATKQATLI